MKTLWLVLPLPVVLLAALLRPPQGNAAAAPPPATAAHRSPTDVALSASGQWAVTANRTSDSVSLIDLTGAGKSVAEIAVGRQPFAVAWTPDSQRAVVTNFLSDTLSILAVSPTGALTLSATLPVGDEPRGLAITRDGAKAYVALSGENTVAVVDLKTKKVTARLPVGTEPWHVALTPDNSRLAVGNTRSRDVTVIDTRTNKTLHTVRVLGRNLRHIAVSNDGKWAYVSNISERGLGTTRENIDRGWVVGNRLARVPLDEPGPREAITLDTQGKAVGDVDGTCLSPDGSTLALTAGGTHELLLMPRAAELPFIAYGGPDDHIDPALRDDPARFRRVPLGGRPLGARFTPDGKSVMVANYFLDAVQVVEVATGTVTKTIALGSGTAAEPALARRGEMLFTNAGRSFNQWFSCNSCHTEGHTNGGNFDTLNDGSYGKPKKTLSLRGVARTAPYTWHGWQKDLRTAVRDSFTKSMQGRAPTEEEVEAVTAYLKTLDLPPNPNRVAATGSGPGAAQQAKRGAAIFQAKACATCHGGPEFTAPIVVRVGLESPDDAYEGFNPPSLRGVYSRAPYLHDGRARTLEEVLTEYHRPSKLTSTPDLTPAELADLIVYLKSL